MNRSSGVRAAFFSALLMLTSTVARTQQPTDPAAEIKLLREQLERQAAELERLRAAVVRLDAALPPPQHSGAPSAAPPPSVPAPPASAVLTFNGLLQGWFAEGDASFQDTFRIRRAELKLSGKLGGNAGWVIMVDPSKSLSMTSLNNQTAINQGSRALQDAFITAGNAKRVLLTAGQFKVPISREGLESSAALDTVERALFASDRARGGNYGDIRDIGVSLRRTSPDRYDVVVGLYNGTGESQNDVDRNERKSVAARLNVFVPKTQGLQVGTSGAWGAGRGADRRDRIGADALYTRGRWKLKSEVTAGRDGALERFGFYGHVGARVSPRLELVARFDSWDPDTAAERGAASLERDYIVGGNVALSPSLRFQANLVRKTFGDDALRTRNLLLINLQTSW